MKDPISITAISSISPLGFSEDEIWASYLDHGHLFKRKNFNGADEWIAPLSNASRKEIDRLKNSDSKYRNLDDSVLFALYASRKAVAQAGWRMEKVSTQVSDQNSGDSKNRISSVRGGQIAKNREIPKSGVFEDKDSNHLPFGVNIGSSRGATSLFEKYHEEFLRDKRAATLSSPTTTLGNISSWVAHDLQTQGPEISHSITCSTALHALLNGVAWINSGMADRFLVGGSEAPLTPFTIAQMKALKVYSKIPPHLKESNLDRKENTSYTKTESADTSRVDTSSRKPVQTDIGDHPRGVDPNCPCQALNLEKNRNTMILGEGAAVACLEKGIPKNALAIIEGIGYATEPLRHNTSISTDAQCFQRSMRMALTETASSEVDVIVMHAPGTVKGDSSEFNAISKVFSNKMPLLTTNKWKAGHSFGASGLLSLEMAVLMLRHQHLIEVPFVDYDSKPKTIRRILVNSVGFGGNAVSVLLNSV